MPPKHHTTALSWIEQLPDVGPCIVRQRDELLALLAQIEALQAIAERRRQALEEEIAAQWLPAEIELAKRRIAA